MHRIVNSAKTRRRSLILLFFLAVIAAAGCATEARRTVATQTVATYGTVYNGPKYTLVVGSFQNRSSYMRGLFSDGLDRLGNQAKMILKTHLQQTNRFTVVDRDNMQAMALEASLRGETQRLKGAQVAITGDVAEFGRRETGDVQLFGILGSGKRQLDYAKVALNVVDAHTSEVIHAVQGAGEYELSNREVIGFGGAAGYDATLNRKVLNLAITNAVDHLVATLERGKWSPSEGR